MSQHPQFNLDRHLNIENMIDPYGRKWEIIGKRESSLVHARPNPYHPQTIIPKEFSGEWTKVDLLKARLMGWLNSEWDKAEAAQQKQARKDFAAKMTVDVVPEPVVKQTPEESLAAIPDEIKQELGEVLAERVTDDGLTVKTRKTVEKVKVNAKDKASSKKA